MRCLSCLPLLLLTRRSYLQPPIHPPIGVCREDHVQEGRGRARVRLRLGAPVVDSHLIYLLTGSVVNPIESVKLPGIMAISTMICSCSSVLLWILKRGSTQVRPHNLRLAQSTRSDAPSELLSVIIHQRTVWQRSDTTRGRSAASSTTCGSQKHAIILHCDDLFI